MAHHYNKQQNFEGHKMYLAAIAFKHDGLIPSMWGNGQERKISVGLSPERPINDLDLGRPELGAVESEYPYFEGNRVFKIILEGVPLYVVEVEEPTEAEPYYHKDEDGNEGVGWRWEDYCKAQYQSNIIDF